ncbi:MAG: glycosyltransferase [Flavobacteriaceae bacterium]|nr:glycosyltransferase [Flavobacteriaceae bacterium]
MSDQNNTKIKICIVTSSLGKGGAQKSSSVLSVLLDSLGYEVYIVSILGNIDYEYRGTLLNLGALKEECDSLFGKLKRFYIFTNFIKTHNFDFIIDSRSRPTTFKQFFINRLIYVNQKVIYVVHSFNLSNYLPKNKFVAQRLYKSAFRFIAVSEAIKSEMINKYQFDNVIVINNAIIKSPLSSNNKPSLLSQNFILFFGRIEDSVKNLTLLIDSYMRSVLSDKNIKLVLLGEGSDKLKLEDKVKAMDMNKNILFLPYMKNPSQIISKAMFSVLTSRFEGFPTMLVESLSLGTPVISVNCQSGPSEIIIDTQNGLLVENYNPESIAQAMNRFVIDNDLYEQCKNNAKNSVEKYNIAHISSHWRNIIESV